jgi:hypothetical protein
MEKIFPYLCPSTARRLRFAAVERVVKVRAVIEAAIDAYSQALAIEADDRHDSDSRARVMAALHGARSLVKGRAKSGLTKVGTAISPEKFASLRQIQGSDRFLSDTVELVLSYYLWQAPESRRRRDDFSGFLWPPIDLPAEINVYRFINDTTGP